MRRGRAVATLIAAVAVTGCGATRLPSYQQRIAYLETIYGRCSKEPSEGGERRCLSRSEGTIRSYIDHLCPHPGGYTLYGEHELCPRTP